MFFSGFQKLHLIPGDSGLGGMVYSSDLSRVKKICLTISSMGGAMLKESMTSILHWSPAYDKYQTGALSMGSGRFAAGWVKWMSCINLPHAYSEPPQVVTCTHLFNMMSNKLCCLTCKATDIDKKVFMAYINAWGDMFMNMGNLSLFAHPLDCKGIVSRDVSLMDMFRSNGKIYYLVCLFAMIKLPK